MSTYWAVAAGLAALAAVIVGGAWYYRSQSRFVHRRAVDTLVSIGRLKADEIAAWREERLGDAATLQEDPHVGELAARYFAAPNDPNARPLLGRFRMMARHFGYADVMLVDTARQVRLCLAEEPHLHNEYESALNLAVRERRPVLTDLHGGESGEPHLSAVAPLFASEAPDAALLGAIVLVSDASSYLFPLLNTWPTPCQTAETTLSRRDGEDVLFLNVLPHRAHDVNGLRVPLTRRTLPAVRAALGEQGVMEGVDYRERPVVAFATRVAGTGWSLVAKQDTEEIFADWRFRSRLILAAMIALVCGIFAGVLAVWRHAQTRHYRDLYASEARLRASTERHSITLKAIGDAVLVTDNQGRVELLNPVAEHLTGWSSAEACGLPLERVFDIINEETRARVPSPVERVLREGEVVGLANHTLLIARDGSECPIADSAAPIHDAQGGITGVVLVFRDQTLEQNYRVLFQRMMDGFAVHEMVRDESGQPTDYRFLAVNPAFERMTGLRAADVVGRTIREVMPGIEQHWIETYDRVVTTGVPVHFERYAAQFDKYFDVAAFRPSLNQFATIIHDITKRKQNEAQQKRLVAAIEQSGEIVMVTDPRGALLYVNEAFERVTGYAWEEVAGQTPRILHSGKHGKAVYRAMWETLKRGDVYRGRLINRRKDGTLFTEDISIAPVTDDAGRTVHYVAVARDVTDRLRLESELHQAQKMESVGRLAGGVAHDFNNMLGVILGNAELALESLDSASPLRADLEEIIHAAKRSSEITQQLLAFARKQMVTPRVLDL
ncbi:MAG: PAS domain S-box protein, partial [Kiritimatiellia bacterium]|nr:PAS domain S-box protein [Kiritimatiellia bacterium]